MKKKSYLIILQWIIIIILVITVLFPLYMVLINAFKAHADIVSNPISFPETLFLDNFIKAWKTANFTTGFLNSLRLVLATAVIVLSVSSFAGYGLCRKRFRGEGLVFSYFLLIMTIPVQLFLFPLYGTFAKLGLIGNIYAVAYVIAAINIPLAIMLMRTFFMGVPLQLEESARLDGANTRQVLFKIVFPCVKPGFITVAVIVILNAWNEYLISSTFLQRERNFTATLGYLSLNGGAITFDQGMKMAGALMIVIPILFFFLSLQKYVVDGLTAGSVKE